MIQDEIKKAISKATDLKLKEINLEVPEIESHGDFAANAALVLSKKKKKNPKELAEEIVSKLKKDKNILKAVSKIEVAGPGFVNFWLSKEYLIRNLKKIAKNKAKYGMQSIGKHKTVVIDYSSPNIAKRFSVGHLRSTVIGQAIYNLYEHLGYKVIGDNHLGDWGTQFGILLYQITSKNLDIETLSIEELEKLYVDFNKKAKDDESLKEGARKWFKKLEDGDPEARNIWQKTVEASMKEFNKVYKILDVSLDEAYGESYYENMMPEIIEMARSKKVSKKSKGAEIIEFDNMPPAMLLKSDGGTTYLTRDMATIKFRLKKWNPDIFIYEVGAEQTLHFRQLFETAKKMGWGKGIQFKHIPHGLFLYEGKKMSTRKGTNIRLGELLEKSINKARELVEKSRTGKELSDKKKENISKDVGVGAVKYFDLSHSPTSNINFKWEEALSLQGNSAPYIQYSYARAKSVIKKANIKEKTIHDTPKNLSEYEVLLMRHLTQFEGVIMNAAKSYSPNLLANYVYNLAQKFNTFYNAEKIIGSESEEFRVFLTDSCAQVIKNSLNLLGINTPEKM